MARGTAEPAERYLFLFLPGGRENKIDPSLLTVKCKDGKIRQNASPARRSSSAPKYLQ